MRSSGAPKAGVGVAVGLYERAARPHGDLARYSVIALLLISLVTLGSCTSVDQTRPAFVRPARTLFAHCFGLPLVAGVTAVIVQMLAS